MIQWDAVDDRGEPQRIEIELTERAPGRARRRRGPGTASEPAIAGVAGPGAQEPAAEPSPTAAGDWSRAAASALAARRRPSYYYPDSEPDAGDDRAADAVHAAVVTSDPEQIGGGPLATERGRLVAVASTAAVVALFIGWALGRSGDDSGSARTVDAATSVSTATTVAVTVLPGEPVPAAETSRPAIPPTTSRTWRTTTTSTVPPVWEESTVAIDPRLAGTTDRIVAVTDDADLLEVDLATGVLRTVAVPRWSDVPNPLPPIAGAGFVAVTFDNGAAPDVFVGDDPTPTRQSTADPWVTYWDTASGTLWTMQYEDSVGRPTQMRETTFDGTATGRTIDLAGMWPSGLFDPRGGIVVGDGTIGTYRVWADGSERLPDGRIVALGLSHVLVYRCGDTLGDCAIDVVDRAAGEARRVPIDDRSAVDRLLNGWWGGPMAGATVTSDGRSALVAMHNGRGVNEVAVLDVVTGRIAELSVPDPRIRPESYAPSASWSTDERFAFVVDDGAVTAYDRESGELFPVSSQLPSVRSLTVRLQL